MAGVDLTPGVSGSAPATAPEVASIASPQQQAVQNQGIPVTSSQSSVLLPATGGCSDLYTVRAGDTLSQIAVNCAVPRSLFLLK